MLIIMDSLHQQFVNEYRLAVQLMIDKKKFQGIVIDEYGTIDKKLKKLGLIDIKSYLSSINSENITEQEKEKKILAQGKKWFGGLNDSERLFL